jgi:hypothetical protein
MPCLRHDPTKSPYIARDGEQALHSHLRRTQLCPFIHLCLFRQSMVESSLQHNTPKAAGRAAPPLIHRGSRPAVEVR